MWSGSKKIVLLLLMIFLMGCAPVETPETPVETQDPPPETEEAQETTEAPETEEVPETTEPIEETTEPEEEIKEPEKSEAEMLLETMTVEEKIHQLFVIGTEGLEPSEFLLEKVSKGIGGVIFFDRNIESKDQFLAFTSTLREHEGDIPLLLSTDEEGGRVQRLRNVAEPVGPALDVIEETAFSYGEILGKNLNTFGLDTGYSPVLDIYSNPENTVIGDRALSRTAEGVLTFLPKVLDGFRSQNILTVGKHCPGHGDTLEDSHEVLPVLTKTKEELEALELIPFKAAIEEKIDMIMVGHLLVTSLDESYPASLSRPVIQELLRDELGFNGVVITDDLTMKAITDNYGIRDVLEQYLLAGGDLILVCHGDEVISEYIETLKVLVDEGVITEDLLDEKVERILDMKLSR